MFVIEFDPIYNVKFDRAFLNIHFPLRANDSKVNTAVYVPRGEQPNFVVVKPGKLVIVVSSSSYQLRLRFRPVTLPTEGPVTVLMRRPTSWERVE